WDDSLGAYDPGRERRDEQRARQLLRSCVNGEEWAMYRDLGFVRVWGKLAEGPTQGGSDETEAGAPYAYLIYPHKPIVAYLPQTRTLLNEYCVAFPDETRPYGSARLPDRAYLKGIGYDDEDLAKPIIGVASTWIETMPCNFHLRALAAKVKEGIREAGGTPMEFNTIAISDGITMGTSGMKTSLVSREVIADSIELVGRGHLFDAVVALSGCDKTIPGTVMALARLNVPSVMLYGGSIPPGRFQGRDVTIIDVFEAVGKHAIGEMTDEELA